MTDMELKTPVWDWELGEFAISSHGKVAVATSGAAVIEIVTKAQATPRGVYPIYARPGDPDLDHKYGSDVADILTRRDLSEAARVSELKRAVVDAIQYDPWIYEVNDVSITQQTISDGENTETAYYAAYTVVTPFDTITVEGVKLE